jgi:TRAP-type mannitol/chloroaromatic compound transport system permease large subunit
LLTLNETLSCGIFLLTTLLVINKKKQYKSIFITSYKKTGALCGMIFFTYICSQFFLESFLTLGGHDLILTKLNQTSDNVSIELILILILIFVFLFQFLFTWLETSFVLVPILLPVISFFNIDVIWFLIIICFSFHNLSFSTPVGLNSISLIKKHKRVPIASSTLKCLPLFFFQMIILTLIILNPSFFIAN